MLSEVGRLNIPQCEAWAREHLHLEIPVDMHLACSMVYVCTAFHSFGSQAYQCSVESSAPTRGVDYGVTAWIFPRRLLLALWTICINMSRCTRPGGSPLETVRTVSTET
jgi:hypothetical protein